MAKTNNKVGILAYGPTGAGKSSQFGYVAEFVHERFGLRSRFISNDKGSLWRPFQSLVDKGIVEALEMPLGHEYNPMATLRKLRRGMWPKGGVIVPSTPVEVQEGKHKVIRYKSNTEWQSWEQSGGAQIGAIGFDSWTGYATGYMSDVKQKNIRIGESGIGDARVEDGETQGTNTQSHYGDAHTEIIDGFIGFQALDVHVVYMTALEGVGKEDAGPTQVQVLGPETVGQKLGGSALPARVQVCLHMQAEGVGAKKIVKAWYDTHPDKKFTQMTWPAKLSGDLKRISQFWKLFPDGYVPVTLDAGIRPVLEFLIPKEG